MKLSSKFNLSGRDPINGAKAGIYDSFTPVEVLTAYATGTGPGVPDDTGTIQTGTIQPGHVVALTAAGAVDITSSPDLSSALPVMFWVVFSGDDDFSGAASGQVNCFHGGARFDTEKFDTGASYTPGAPLKVSGGVVTPKTSYSDRSQVLGYVGPRGLLNGVLDVFMPQSVAAG